jgi:hypothetical protein
MNQFLSTIAGNQQIIPEVEKSRSHILFSHIEVTVKNNLKSKWLIVVPKGLWIGWWWVGVGQQTVAFRNCKGNLVYEHSVITWENIVNLSGKAGNKLYTQSLHNYIKMKKENKQKAMHRKSPRRKQAKLSAALWVVGNRSFYFCHNFLYFCIFPIFYSKHAQLLLCQKNKLYI